MQTGINPKHAEGLRRRLTFSYAINDEIKQTTLSRNKNAMKIVEVVVGSRILRKYKMINMAAKELNLNRKRLADVTDKILKISRKKRSLKEQGKHKQQVIDFMERCDNSTVHPNKQEVKYVDGSLKAKRVQTDFMDNLYEKFLLENADVKISRATFFRCRQSYTASIIYSKAFLPLHQTSEYDTNDKAFESGSWFRDKEY